MDRRLFLKNGTAAGAMLALSSRPSMAKQIDAHVEIFVTDTQGRISPDLYGHFTEHIGGVIYDGVWVGENSRIPNDGGIRRELLDRLKEIRVPILRWPGGCFADSYDWRDGIGPQNRRPKRTSFWEVEPEAARLKEAGPQIFEPNTFGTDEFMRFCKLTHAKPYVAANLRSLTPLDFDHWVEYCNSPEGSTTLAEMRKANGTAAPYGVQYWGVGNESWGCGGNFTPEEYASEFRRFTNWVPQYGIDLNLIGAGPNSNDRDWTHRFFEEIFTGPHSFRKTEFTGWSVHHYAADLSRGRPGTNFHEKHGQALVFGEVDWYELLRETCRIEEILLDQWSLMGQFDQNHHVKLVVDEYGPWYHQGTELDPTHIFGQQITIRDALATASSLDIFNRHAEKISVATCAQLVNNLNALFLCHEEKFLCTPNYHVFKMYADHQGGQSLRVEFGSSSLHYDRDGKDATFWGLSGSASRSGKMLTFTVVNPDLHSAKEIQVAINGAVVTQVDGQVLNASSMQAHNTFAEPNVVQTRPLSVQGSGESVYVTLPPASVTKISATLA